MELTERRDVEFSAKTECSSLEILQYPSLAKPKWQEGKVDDETLSGWLEKDLSLPCSAPQVPESPSGGLRLLIAKCEWNQENSYVSMSFKEETFSIVEKCFGLPGQYSSLISSSQSCAFKYSIHEHGHPARSGFISKIPFYRNIFFQLVLKHNPATNLTHALLLVKSESPLLKALLLKLQSQQQYTTQPSFLSLLASDFVINNCRERLSEAEMRLDDLEETMGQHEYEYRRRGNPLELDFLATTRTLNFWGKRVAVDVVRLKCQILALEKMREWEKMTVMQVRDELRNKGGRREVGSVAGSLEVGTQTSVAERIEYLKDTCDVLLYEAEYEDKRVRALIQVVYQFMAQKDAKVNIALAESSAAIAKASKEDSAVMRTIAIESKRDSSAMKTIAILGMFFLPGTFIAAIFAMPVFNWDGNGSPVIKTGFKYYWAVTAPLTLFVLVLWALAMLLPWKSWVAKVQEKEKADEQDVKLAGL